jgi:hypothetical protein
MQSANRPFPGRSASSNRGQDNFTELPPKNRIGPWTPPKPPQFQGKLTESGAAEDPAGEPFSELRSLLLRDLVQLDGPEQVLVDTFHPG